MDYATVNNIRMGYHHVLSIVFLVRATVALANNRTVWLEYDETAGEPLYLTPLIENGHIEEARDLAIVRHQEIGDILSYSGYFTVDKQYDSNTFFWFFPAQEYPETAPLLVWLQGGPGLTSLLGLFKENGPFRVGIDGTLELRNYTWMRSHSIVYIDNPIGTGYSFTRNENGYARNQTQISEHLLDALVQFFELFPEFRDNDFFVIGKSSGGKIAATLSHAIAKWNARSLKKINLKGLAISSGYISPKDQIMTYDNYFYELGLIDLNGKELFRRMEKKIRRLICDGRYHEANFKLDSLLGGGPMPSIFQTLTGFDYYPKIFDNSAPNDNTSFSNWIQRTDVRSAIHVGDNSFQVINTNVQEHLAEDLLQSVAPTLAKLTDYYRILFYNGQLDIVSPYPSIEYLLRNLRWSGSAEYLRAPRKQWWVGQELAGYSKTVRNLTEVLVRSAGHDVSADQPKWVLDLVTKFTRNQPMTSAQPSEL